ncbi:MAG TPA: hypothetical protein VK171_08815 [Fimbriimonas sp.]|nr:hypothetical protein [Fimbriimonas sp.]
MGYDNTGILTANNNRKTDSHPSHTGSINIEGVDYWLSAWVNEGKPGSRMEGKRYFSLKVNRKDDQGSRPAPRQNSSFDEDDIPF